MGRLSLATMLMALACASAAPAAIIIGPGDTVIDANDGGADLIAVDLTAPMVLAAGTYTADFFNYQFLQATDDLPLGGTVQPFLAVSSGVDAYTVIALGDIVTFTGETGFISTAFGGSNSFTLGAATTVYAAFFWDGEVEVNRSPIGFLDSAGSTFVRFDGANPPTVNGVISGGDEDTFDRTYDFSITVNPAAAVPEPSTFVLAGLGGLGLAGLIRRRRRA